MMKTFVTIFVLNFLYCLGAFAQTEEKHSVWYLKDVNSNLTVDSLLKKEKDFSLLSNNKLSFGHGNNPFWLRISFKNEDSLAYKKLLEVEYAFLDEVNLFLENNGKIVYQSDTLGWEYPYSERIFKHYNPVFPVTISGKSSQTAYFRIYRGSLSMIPPIRVWNEEDFYENEIKRKFIWGGFGGILLFVALIGFFLFLYFRKTLYLFYSIYILMSLFYVLLNKGFFLEYYQDGFLIFYSKNTRQVFMILNILFIQLFIKEYLFSNYKLPKWLQLLFRISILICVSGIVMLWYEKYAGEHQILIPQKSRVLFPFTLLLPIFFSFYLVFYSYFKKIDVVASKFYLIGISPLVIFATLSTARNYGIVPNHLLLETEGSMICYLFDILTLAVGLGYRYKILRDEKEHQQKLAYEAKLRLLYERESISRDLHDNVGSQLSVIASNLDSISFLAEKQKLTSEKVETVNEFVREAIQSLRDTIWATHQETFSLAEFRARVQQYIHKYYQSEISQISVNFEGNDISLSSSQTLNLFRIIQESLNNATKYAQASSVSINLRIVDKQIQLNIIDNGVGFDVESKKIEPHFGLLNMQKRVNEIDGKLNIKSKLGAGTNIEVLV
jgi:two-component system, sensor histidine kinase LadS